MARNVNRRGFIKGSLAASAAVSLAASDKAETHAAESPHREPSLKVPTGKIKHVEISRLICGGNLIIGSAHDRDLLYVASLMRHYFTDRKIIETWQTCEECGFLVEVFLVHRLSAQSPVLSMTGAIPAGTPRPKAPAPSRDRTT